MHLQSKLWDLENFGMLKALSKEENQKLGSLIIMRHVPKRQILYFPADNSSSIYLLKASKVKISRMSPDGKEIVLTILGSGEIFGGLV